MTDELHLIESQCNIEELSCNHYVVSMPMSSVVTDNLWRIRIVNLYVHRNVNTDECVFMGKMYSAVFDQHSEDRTVKLHVFKEPIEPSDIMGEPWSTTRMPDATGKAKARKYIFFKSGYHCRYRHGLLAFDKFKTLCQNLNSTMREYYRDDWKTHAADYYLHQIMEYQDKYAPAFFKSCRMAGITHVALSNGGIIFWKQNKELIHAGSVFSSSSIRDYIDIGPGGGGAYQYQALALGAMMPAEYIDKCWDVWEMKEVEQPDDTVHRHSAMWSEYQSASQQIQDYRERLEYNRKNARNEFYESVNEMFNVKQCEYICEIIAELAEDYSVVANRETNMQIQYFAVNKDNQVARVTIYKPKLYVDGNRELSESCVNAYFENRNHHSIINSAGHKLDDYMTDVVEEHRCELIMQKLVGKTT